MGGPSVVARLAGRVIELAVARGADRRALHEASGIDPADLADPDARLPLARHVALLRAAKSLCGDPAFALHYGETVNLAEVSVVGLIGYASETMLDAFVQLQRYERLVMDLDLGLGAGPRFALERDPRGLWIVDRRPDPNASARAHRDRLRADGERHTASSATRRSSWRSRSPMPIPATAANMSASSARR